MHNLQKKSRKKEKKLQQDIVFKESHINAWQAFPNQEELGNRNIIAQTIYQKRTKMWAIISLYLLLDFSVPTQADKAKLLTWIPGDSNDLKQEWQWFYIN